MAEELNPTSPSGAPLYEHRARRRQDEPRPADSSEWADSIRAHIERHLGPIHSTFHELESDLVRLDLEVVAPTTDRPFYTVITSGMSARPMTVPEGLDECRYVELLICLPADWPLLDRERLADETNYWPLRWLKTLARFPHEYETWLYWQHTVPNGEPPRPFAANTELSSLLLLDPLTTPPDFARLDVGDEREIHFFGVIPIHAAELQFKLDQGADALEHRLRRAGVDELLQPDRASVV